jgi:hypothetical protein
MSEVSTVSPDLFLLSSEQDFQEHSLKLLTNTRRTLAILSRELDPFIYGNDAFISALSTFARSSQYTQVQILVKDTKPLVENNHKLVKLHQRLPSKIQLRKLIIEPDNTEMGFMLCDTTSLVFKNDDRVYKGFANYSAAAEVKRFREVFDYVWQYAETEAEFQVLNI